MAERFIRVVELDAGLHPTFSFMMPSLIDVLGRLSYGMSSCQTINIATEVATEARSYEAGPQLNERWNLAPALMGNRSRYWCIMYRFHACRAWRTILERHPGFEREFSSTT